MAVTKSQLIPQEHLREIFEYRDGALYWRRDPHQHERWNGRLAGKKAGYRSALGYTEVSFTPTERNGLSRRCHISVHRLVFCYFHGYYPPTVDHINGDRGDDRIENLRAAASSENAANRTTMRNNTTGVPGVRRHRDGHYEARVQFAGKRHQVGSFRTLDEARDAVAVASRAIKGEWHPERAL